VIGRRKGVGGEGGGGLEKRAVFFIYAVRLFIIRYDLNSVVHQNLDLDFFVMIFTQKVLIRRIGGKRRVFFNSRDAVVAI
jgi:hypothetical protein